jgi:hypothetical protein
VTFSPSLDDHCVPFILVIQLIWFDLYYRHCYTPGWSDFAPGL